MSQLFNRRSALGVAGGAGLALTGSTAALAAKFTDMDVEPRGTDGILERLPDA